MDEAIQIVEKEAESMCFDANCYPELAGLPREQQLRLEKDLIYAHKEAMIGMVRSAWDDREGGEDW